MCKLPLLLQVQEWMRAHEREGATCVLAAVGPCLVAAFAITDPLKPEAASVVAALRRLGLRCHMVTGDGWVTARAISAKLGIVDVSAEVGPAGVWALWEGRLFVAQAEGLRHGRLPCLQRCQTVSDATWMLCAVCCVLCAVCCVLCAACCVLRAACCVLRAVCCVLRAACCVLRAVCCVLRAVCCVLCAVCCAGAACRQG